MLCLNSDRKDAPHAPSIYISQGSVLFLPGLLKQVKPAVKQCFSVVQPHLVYSFTYELLSATKKDILPALNKSNVIYQFSCHCDSRYVGRTIQMLQDRIKQHVPESIRSCCSSEKHILSARLCETSTQTIIQSLASDSTIGFHVLQNPVCVQHYYGSIDFLFLPKGDLLSIYLLLKPLSSKLLPPP